MRRTHKVRLYPNNRQASYLFRCCGVARFAYNWALARWNEQYAKHVQDPDGCPRPSQYSLRRELNAVKATEFPWMLEVTKYAPQRAIIDLGRAFDNFFGKRAAYPKFKKKGVRDSFYIGSDQLKVSDRQVWVPGLYRFMGKRKALGWVRMAEALRWDGAKIISATVSRTADKWYISIACELPDAPNVPAPKAPEAVGIDVGVREFVTSDDERCEVPRALRNAQRRLRREQRSLARKQKGSKNRARQKMKVARLHQRIVSIRGDWLHKLSHELTASHDVIVLEDLNVKGMQKSRHLAMSIADASFYEFRRQVEYKSKEYGCEVIVAGRWYPSSKTCSNCGSVKTKLSLGERTYVCDKCGLVIDRDLNAAINLRNLAVSSTVTACGEFSASTSSETERASSLDEAGIERHFCIEQKCVGI